MAKREGVKIDGMLSEFVTAKSSVHILRPHLPNRRPEPLAVSVHRGILITWDEDYDSRVIDFINSLCDDALAYIHWVSEWKGCLAIGLCTGSVVDEVAAMIGSDGTGIEVCGDWWCILWHNSTTGSEVQTGGMA